MKRIALTCCCLIISGWCLAQENLDLENAIRLGLDKNFSIQIENQRIEIARNNNTLGNAGMWPSVNVGATQSLSRTEINNPASFLSSGNIKGSSLNPTVGVGWTLFNGFNVRISKDKLDFLERQSVGNAQVVVENSIQSIILAYYTALLEEERLSVFKRTLKLSSDRYEYGKLRGQIGTAVTFDILQDKSAYLTDSSNYILQIQNFNNAVRNLNLLMGVDVDETYELTDSLNVTPQKFDRDDLFARMTSNNSNLKNQYLNQEVFKRDVLLAKSSMYPIVSLNLNGSRNQQVQDLSSAVFASGQTGDSGIKSSTLNYTAGITLNFTLFNGGKIRTQLENARVNEQISLIQVSELKASLKNNLISNFDQYNLRSSLLSIAKENVETATLNLQMATDRYRNGTISSFDYRDIQINYLTSSLNYLQAIFNVIETETELLRLTGGLSAAYD
ncbi:MAG: TolC family protein [Cyclobacteriaceae bacterium]